MKINYSPNNLGVLDTNIILDKVSFETLKEDKESLTEIIDIMLRFNLDPNKLYEDYSELISNIAKRKSLTSERVSKCLDNIKSEFNLKFVITSKIKEEVTKYINFNTELIPDLLNKAGSDKIKLSRLINKISFSRFRSRSNQLLNSYTVIPSPPKELSILKPTHKNYADAQIFDACIYNNVGALITHNFWDFHRLNNSYKDIIGSKLLILNPTLKSSKYIMDENISTDLTASDILQIFIDIENI